MTRGGQVSEHEQRTDAPQTRLSLPEIDALCTKAARGAGYAWGVAEEAGYAARWLSAHGLPGPEALAAHLVAFDGKSWANIVPAMGARWSNSDGGLLCPLATGIALADFAASLVQRIRSGFSIEAVARPVLILPFVQRAAATVDAVLSVRSDLYEVTVSTSGCDIAWCSSDCASASVSSIAIATTKRGAGAGPCRNGQHLAPATLGLLESLASRTYVPASAKSRAGAGAAASDND